MPTQPRSTPRPGAGEGRVAPVGLMAAVLVHFLGRDEPHPTRWTSDSFVIAVAAERASLDVVESAADLDGHAPVTDAPFSAAVAGLANDPRLVALAIRRLELGNGERLPAWPVLLRRGLRVPARTEEPSTWLG